MKREKQGISLIVLVLTIIIMIILAAAVIITLSNSNIIERADNAVAKTDMAQIQELASIAWTEAYADDRESTVEELKEAVMDNLKANGYSDETLDDYNITVTTEGVTVTEKVKLPAGWETNVATIVDTVPIPKGFVASPYDGENTKDGGLVIYELGATETAIPSTETHQDSLTKRNQYVWIPVDKTTFSTTFVRQNFGLTYSISNTLGTDCWEVMPTTDETTDNNKKYLVQGTTLAEVQAMYASVEEYGGFYIARYEAGIDTRRTSKGDDPTALPSTLANVHSKMGKIPYTYIPWTWNDAMNNEANGAVSVARSLYPKDSNTTGVVSTLTYGVQWDAAVEWLRTNGKDINGNAIESVTNSIAYGNYTNHEIKAGDLNEGAQYAIYFKSTATLGTFGDVTYVEDGSSTNTKSTSTAWALSTGALKAAKVNNIYDMAGNMFEWTMEGNSYYQRVYRGGSFRYSGDNYPLAYRNYITSGSSNNNWSFRPSLYIKK